MEYAVNIMIRTKKSGVRDMSFKIKEKDRRWRESGNDRRKGANIKLKTPPENLGKLH